MFWNYLIQWRCAKVSFDWYLSCRRHWLQISTTNQQLDIHLKNNNVKKDEMKFTEWKISSIMLGSVNLGCRDGKFINQKLKHNCHRLTRNSVLKSPQRKMSVQVWIPVYAATFNPSSIVAFVRPFSSEINFWTVFKSPK